MPLTRCRGDPLVKAVKASLSPHPLLDRNVNEPESPECIEGRLNRERKNYANL
jgi:hypothetical protein